MPQQHFNFDIIVEITDLVLGNTKLKRKATFETLIYNKKSGVLSVAWKVEYYADNNGQYGAKLDASGITAYSKEQLAGAASYVNLDTQEMFIATPTTVFPENYSTEFEFYNFVAETQTVNIHSLIRAQAAKIA